MTEISIQARCRILSCISSISWLMLNEIREPTNTLVSAGDSAGNDRVFLVVMADAATIDDAIYSGAIVAGIDSGNIADTTKDSADVPRCCGCLFYFRHRATAIRI